MTKNLNEHEFCEIGSLHPDMSDDGSWGYWVDRQLCGWNYGEHYYKDGYPHFEGPFETTMMYYATILHNGWKLWEDGNRFGDDPNEVRKRFELQIMLTSMLSSTYVRKHDPQKYYLRHTTLFSSSILVDHTNGSITGLIDWQCAGTYPSESADNYPLLLNKDIFVGEFKDIYQNPLSELEEWRSVYAEQFKGDKEMEEFLCNVDERIKFEDTLRWPEGEGSRYTETLEQLADISKGFSKLQV
jgi:hypothetical protein